MVEPLLAVVVIGRNEGVQLVRCLEAVRRMRAPEGGIEVVYVDTASADGSPEHAEKVGIRVIRLFPERPTAAMGRDTGWRATRAPFVLFIDGDSQIEPEFAVQALERFADPKVAVVWGRLREAYPEASIYNRFMDSAWRCLRDLPEGPTFYGTGIGMARRTALEAVNGFTVTMAASENTEMGNRMQALGWVVWHAAIPMVRHDANIHRLSRYWKRFYWEGYAWGRLEAIYKESRRPLFRFEFSPWRGVFLVAALLTGVVVWWAPVVVLGMILSKAWEYRTNEMGIALLFSLHWHAKLIPNALGYFTYQQDQRSGRVRRSMAYR